MHALLLMCGTFYQNKNGKKMMKILNGSSLFIIEWAWWTIPTNVVFVRAVIFTINVPLNNVDNLTYNGCGLLSMISCLSISSKERKMGMLTFHNMIWNARYIQSVLDCLWGKPLRWIYVRSVISLNCTNIDNDIN